MLYQVLSTIIVSILKFLMWILVSIVAVPYGVFMLLQELFPIFTQDAGFWFWSVLGLITIVAYVILWKPILWVVGTISVLGAGE